MRGQPRILSFHDKYGNGQILIHQPGYLFWFSKVAEAKIDSSYERKNSGKVSEVVILLLCRKFKKSESSFCIRTEQCLICFKIE